MVKTRPSPSSPSWAMRVTSTMGMRSVCSPRSTKTAAGRFQTQPPLGQRMVSACDWGVTVTSPTVTLSPEVVCHLNMSLDRFIKPPPFKFVSDTLLTDALVWRLAHRVCFPTRERSSGSTQRAINTAAKMTKAFTMPAIAPCAPATAVLNAPCHRVVTRTLPPVLLYNHVRTRAPDMMLTVKATTPNRFISKL